MKELNIHQMEEINGGGWGQLACMVLVGGGISLLSGNPFFGFGVSFLICTNEVYA